MQATGGVEAVRWTPPSAPPQRLLSVAAQSRLARFVGTRRLMMKAIRFLATMLVLSGPGQFVVGSAGAVPEPPPKFWSPARCERAMLARPLAPPRQVICVGSGGPPACRWTSGHRTRLYSEFRVFTRYRQTGVRGVGLEPGVVRSFTLATRARPGFARVVHHWGEVRRLASRLLQGPPSGCSDPCNSRALSLDRRFDRSPPHARGEATGCTGE